MNRDYPTLVCDLWTKLSSTKFDFPYYLFLCHTFPMKKLTLILTLIFSVMFSSTSFAEWKKVITNVSGDTFYVDFESIRKHDGHVYWWDLTDYFEPSELGVSSAKTYLQGDCKVFRYKWLSLSFHREPMGGGTSEVIKLNKKDKKWRDPPPPSSEELILKSICQYAR